MMLKLMLLPSSHSLGVWSSRAHHHIAFHGLFQIPRSVVSNGQVCQDLDNTEDIFDSTLNLESDQLQVGFDEGFKDGIEAGKIEGREVGLKVGFQVGEELGFYKGCMDIWKVAISRCPGLFSARVQKRILLLEEQLKNYPLSNSNDEKLQDMLEMIRARFRSVLAMLSVHIEYEGYPGSHMEERSEF
ncbi:hypothetical protein KP509_17G072800 [Ceratopteris richardii]|uniref:Essential protein Yae1 N-terminal domain-containing protein n=1 Tax=Ceratopteris richardii TaxID=49495 RepID=A0A8T2SWR9_CERRI|nr:hypothetical protein KP509_17G072800 [Ceratopteris richardii]